MTHRSVRPSPASERVGRGSPRAWPSRWSRPFPSGCPVRWRAVSSRPAGVPGPMTLVRVGLAAAALTPFGIVALRGRWVLLRRNLGLLVAYGAIAVAGAQFCYFSAVQHMQVGPAILIEFTAPAVVVVYLWLRHGQRPGRMTLGGAGLAALGLVLVLDLVSGADLSLPGCVVGAGRDGRLRDVLHHQRRRGQRPSSAGAGLGRPGRRRAGARAARASSECCRCGRRRRTTSYADVDVAWWVPLVLLGLVTAALAYVAGIAAGRRLGSRLASFVALLEVRRERLLGVAAPARAARRCAAARRLADPGRRGGGQARRAVCVEHPGSLSAGGSVRSECNICAPSCVFREWM